MIYLFVYILIGWLYQVVLENHYMLLRPNPRQWVAAILTWPVGLAKWLYSTVERLYRQFKNNEWE